MYLDSSDVDENYREKRKKTCQQMENRVLRFVNFFCPCVQLRLEASRTFLKHLETYKSLRKLQEASSCF